MGYGQKMTNTQRVLQQQQILEQWSDRMCVWCLGTARVYVSVYAT